MEIGHPPPEVERRILRERKSISPIDAIQPVLNKNMVIALQSLVDQVEIVESVLQYAHDLILTLRRSPLVEVGPSTRAALALMRAVRAYALLRGRTYVTPDDVKRLAVPVLAHRIRPRSNSLSSRHRRNAVRAVEESLAQLRVPT
ncbi:MAG: MoxR family ATPase [Deltaproteobacteria bacterium]|nr:MoxR family ATPase [Deltaproteobacteria bacterium]